MATELGSRPGGVELRQQTLRSVFWILTVNIVRSLALFLLPVGIAWLSGPVELGLAHVAYGVYAIALPFVTMGTRAAVLQHREAGQSYLSSVFFLNLLTGAATAAVLVAGAPWIAAIGKGDPRLVVVIRWIGVISFVSSLSVVQNALLARRLAYRTLSLATITGVVAGGLAGLGAAATGARLGAVGAAAAGYVVVSTVALWVVGRWRPSRSFVPREALAAVRFGVTASAASFANNLAGQLERFFISSVLGPAALGLYGAARNVNRDSLRNLMQITDEVLLPGLASLQSDVARARRYYLNAVRFEFLAFAPAAVFVGVFARDLVLLVYGSAWLDAVPLVRVMTPLVLFTITNHTIGAVFLSQGRPDTQLRWSLISIVLVAAYLATGVSWGLLGVVTALSTLELAGWLTSHSMANRLLQLPLRRFLANLALPLAASLLFGALLLLLRRLPWWAAAPASWPSLALWALAALPLYAAVLHGLDRETSRSFWHALAEVARTPVRRSYLTESTRS
jgi:O-antigen/teichoic acid export membrane protein